MFVGKKLECVSGEGRGVGGRGSGGGEGGGGRGGREGEGGGVAQTLSVTR